MNVPKQQLKVDDISLKPTTKEKDNLGYILFYLN